MELNLDNLAVNALAKKEQETFSDLIAKQNNDKLKLTIIAKNKN